jgi:ribosomal protein L11 methyltransferase
MEKAILDIRESTIEYRVIDIGCGSGILSIAAIKLGARRVLGVDVDEESIVNSRENSAANGVGEELMLGVGSVQEILTGRFPIKSAPLVVANILAPVIVRLFDAGMAALIEEGGVIILSGILIGQEQSVLEAAQAHGLRLIERKQIADWVALAMNRTSP